MKAARIADSTATITVSARPTMREPARLTSVNTITTPAPTTWPAHDGKLDPASAFTYSENPAAYSEVAIR